MVDGWASDGGCSTRAYSDPLARVVFRIIEKRKELAVHLVAGRYRRHTIEPGETWTQLSQWWYGDPSLAALIAVANDLVIEQVPPAGRTLYFPDLAEF